ncbi:ornithine cyclodeaminase family protein [Candidatus Halobonum tyrrellensis]|uniref:Ornithine cyclodeaminase n=1 Tax=Candidatus Halobonum tyrrellensis G22 TaxID=1324957 RepID=V4HB85_9EURY|nr:ornithine cyclodeaminase family protein [Candidatus Halobonum tyrrellensis]ESP87960.1 ornithine cyclodeaminase [Candidatus Halobonum tyrrellensis G22]
MRVLSDDDVAGLLSLSDLLSVVEAAFVKQGRGEVERPDRPHFPVGEGLDGRTEPAGTGLTMPAYVHGAEAYATKLASVHPDNPERGLPTIHAQVVVTDAETGDPLALLAGERVTNARTGCIGGLAARHLAAGDGPVTVGVLGAGAQARWQTRAIDAARGVADARVHSPTPASRADCAADLGESGIDATAVESADAAVRDADVVVTATTSHSPVFDGDALAPGTLVVAVGAYTAEARELDDRTFERAARVFADVPEEVAEIGDVADNGVNPAELVPLSAVFEGDAGRERDDEILVVDSVGSAVLDAAAAVHLYDAAVEAGVGSDADL